MVEMLKKNVPNYDTLLTPYRKPEKVGRNDPFPYGSGKKSKKCCLGKTWCFS